jgi:hypothetical protein
MSLYAGTPILTIKTHKNTIFPLKKTPFFHQKPSKTPFFLSKKPFFPSKKPIFPIKNPIFPIKNPQKTEKKSVSIPDSGI